MDETPILEICLAHAELSDLLLKMKTHQLENKDPDYWDYHHDQVQAVERMIYSLEGRVINLITN